jgi:hypothetical protein
LYLKGFRPEKRHDYDYEDEGDDEDEEGGFVI